MDRIKQLLFEDKQDWIGPKVWAYLTANPTFLLTTLYLCISGLGLVYEYVLFGKFGINVLDYSEAADFFLAAFKRPEAFLSSIAIVGSLIFYRVVANFARRQRNVALRIILLFISWPGLFRREILAPLGAIYFVFVYVSLAEIEARSLVFSSDTIATIGSRFGAPQKARIIPIGATERFIFGVQYSDELIRLRQTDGRVDIAPLIIAIPFTNIVGIRYQNTTIKGMGDPSYNGTQATP